MIAMQRRSPRAGLGVPAGHRCRRRVALRPRATAQRIYFGNHSSHLDFIVIWSALPPGRGGVPARSPDATTGSGQAVRRYLASEVFRAVLVERRGAGADDAAAAARASVEQMAQEMGDRDSLIVFPEGTRSANGRSDRSRAGSTICRARGRMPS